MAIIHSTPFVTAPKETGKRKPNPFAGLNGRKKELLEREPNGRVRRKSCPDYSIYVIVADAERDMVKIGASRNPKKRVAEIDVSCPYRALLRYEKKLTGKNALNLEKAIHNYLKGTPFHISGEWYSFGLSTAIAIINKSLEKLSLT